MLTLNTNMASLITQSSFKTSTQLLNQAVERMSSGYKINHAKDNAANYSISTNMTTKINSYLVAQDNVANGMDMLSTADDSLSMISDKLSRLRALAMQSLNASYDRFSQNSINAEANALVEEIQRISSSARYNGISLVNTSLPSEVANSGASAPLNTAYNGFVDSPIDYTDAQVAAMTTIASVSTSDVITQGQYSISTVEELAKLAVMANNGKIQGGEYVLANDIDLSAYSTGEGWTPIGNLTNSFIGDFNGNGHVISNLYINRPNGEFQGLFGVAKGTFKNLGIEKFYIKSKSDSAVLMGMSQTGSNFYNVYSKNGDVITGSWAAGLVGSSNGQSSYTACYSIANVTGSGYVGLIIGSGNPDMYRCFGIGNVKGFASTGGLAGKFWAGNIDNCYFEGTVTASQCGGIIGAIDTTNITNCTVNATITGNTQIGGIVSNIAAYVHPDTMIDVSNNVFLGNLVGTGVKGSFAGAIQIANGTSSITNLKLDNNYVEKSENLTIGKITTQDGQTVVDPSEAGINTFIKSTGDLTLQVGISSDLSSQMNFNLGINNDDFWNNLKFLNLSDASSLEIIDNMIKTVNNKQVQLGTNISILDSILDEVTTNLNSLTSSRSTIKDADIADVSSEYIMQQILQQASATLMSTANQSPSIALQLI